MDNSMKYMAAENVNYIDAELTPPPKATKIILLTAGGIATLGNFFDHKETPFWAPLPKLNKEQKAKFNRVRL